MACVETDFVEIIPNVDLIKLFENHMLSCLYTLTTCHENSTQTLIFIKTDYFYYIIKKNAQAHVSLPKN